MFTTSTLVVLLPAKKPVIIRLCCDYLAYLIIYQYLLRVRKNRVYCSVVRYCNVPAKKLYVAKKKT
jgi:hypothetical protein